MAGFAAEAAYFGKPALVSGYFAPEMREHLDPSLVPPTLLCSPDDLQQGIERMITDRAFREELGALALDYVRDRWSPSSVASRFLRLIDGDIPIEWMYDPSGLRYIFGFGMPEALVRAGVRAVIQNAGPEGLCVSHNRELETRLLALAR